MNKPQNKVLKPNYKNDLKNKTKKQVTTSSTQVYTEMVLQILKNSVLVVAQLNTNSIQFIFFFFFYQWSSVNSLTITVIIGGLCWRGKKKRKGGWGGDGGSLMWVWWHPLNEGAKGGRLLILGGACSSLWLRRERMCCFCSQCSSRNIDTSGCDGFSFLSLWFHFQVRACTNVYTHSQHPLGSASMLTLNLNDMRMSDQKNASKQSMWALPKHSDHFCKPTKHLHKRFYNWMLKASDTS